MGFFLNSLLSLQDITSRFIKVHYRVEVYKRRVVHRSHASRLHVVASVGRCSPEHDAIPKGDPPKGGTAGNRVTTHDAINRVATKEMSGEMVPDLLKQQKRPLSHFFIAIQIRESGIEYA